MTVAEVLATIEIHIPGTPVAQGRPRFARHGRHVRAYDPLRSRLWKARAQSFIRLAMAGRAPLEGPVSCEILATFACPKGDRRQRKPARRRWHTKLGDPDNVAKAVLDAASGLCFGDDAQVARLTVVKVIAAQDEAPGVWLKVERLGEEEVTGG